ncbi:hypothetical protein OGAPHI_001612 [Ogataea philodendri]|uniref:Uncharacterized protein n=1 Tax=Ogataea philodendri TaxID=1378263 RepID=A0A9P8PCX1_9ASCO|nr:uncharacterized protein OGAPHI_001612 [Ogataea philodendri]KAH3669491.1 hypothetical protein OGAPHI_001612 [Ogataea philodendri]
MSHSYHEDMDVESVDPPDQFYQFSVARGDESVGEVDQIGDQLFTKKKKNWLKSMVDRKRRSKNLDLNISGTKIPSMPMVSRFERRNDEWRERQNSTVAPPQMPELFDRQSLPSNRKVEREMREIRRSNGDEERVFRESFLERSNNGPTEWFQKISSKVKADRPRAHRQQPTGSKFAGTDFDKNLRDYMWYNNGVKYPDRQKGLQNRERVVEMVAPVHQQPSQPSKPQLQSTIFKIHESIQSSLQFIPVVGVLFQLFGILYSMPLLPPEIVVVMEIFAYAWVIRFLYGVYVGLTSLLQPLWNITRLVKLLLDTLQVDLHRRHNLQGLVQVVLERVLGSVLVVCVPEISQVLASSVVDQNVWSSVVWNVRQNILGTVLDDVLLQLSRRDRSRCKCGVVVWLQTKEVGQQSSNVWRSHRSSGKSGSGSLGANVSGQHVQTRTKDVNTLTVVGEVCSGVRKRGSTNSDSRFCGSWRVVASVSIVVTSSNGKVETGLDSSIDGQVESWRLTTSKRHVGGGTLETSLLFLRLSKVGVGGEFDTLDDIGHRTRTVGSKDLDCNQVGVLGNTVVLRTNSTCTVGSVTVSVLIGVTNWDSLTPFCSAAKLLVVDVDTSIDNVGGDTISGDIVIDVLVEVSETEGFSVGNSGKTPWSTHLGLLLGCKKSLILNIWVRFNDSLVKPNVEASSGFDSKACKACAWISCNQDMWKSTESEDTPFLNTTMYEFGTMF